MVEAKCGMVPVILRYVDLYSLMIILPFVFISQQLYPQNNNYAKCDFIIESIKCIVTYQDGHDQTGMPVRNRYKRVELLVVIKNIGEEDFNGALYLARTNSVDDALLNLYSRYELIQPNPLFLGANSFYKIKYSYYVDRNVSVMKFKINEYSDYDLAQKESDYFNNTYSVTLE